MPTEALFAMVAFGGLFTMWVVVPTFLRKRASERTESEPTVERN
ncbi:MAG: hypothetical protein WD533_05300 [Dehalococcoidia bacterium]